MKIILITRLTNADNCKTSRIELAHSLRKRGHNVTVVMAKNINRKETETAEMIYLPTVYKPILFSVIYGLFISLYLPFSIRKTDTDIIMIDGMKGLFPFIIPLSFLHIPLVMDIRTLQVDKKRSLIYDLSLHYSRNFIDAYTAITPELRNILVTQYRWDKKRIGLWSSGVSLEQFGKIRAIDTSIKSPFNEDDFVLMYHGSYSPTRGLDNLLKSIAFLDKKASKKIKLFIVGVEPKKELQRIINESQIQDQIVFIPQVSYELISQYISLADVGVIPLPPDNEWWQVSSPLKTLEYLSMGKPIIATNIPFHERIFNHGICGILLDSAEPKKIAEAIMKLYHNLDDTKQMGKIGRKIIEEQFTWDKKALEVEKFLGTVTNEN